MSVRIGLATPSPKVIAACVLALAMVLLASQGAVAAQDCGGGHSHSSVEIDCFASVSAGEQTWSGTALSTADTIMSEIWVRTMGVENCFGTVMADWNHAWKSATNDWIVGDYGSGGLEPLCYPNATLVAWGLADWSTAHVHSTAANMPHPHRLVP